MSLSNLAASFFENFSGYTGTNCEQIINTCLSNPCDQGLCIFKLNGYQCNCAIGYTGVICDTIIDNCVNNSCGMNGICKNKLNGYNCICNPGYTGAR